MIQILNDFFVLIKITAHKMIRLAGHFIKFIGGRRNRGRQRSIAGNINIKNGRRKQGVFRFSEYSQEVYDKLKVISNQHRIQIGCGAAGFIISNYGSIITGVHTIDGTSQCEKSAQIILQMQ